jgi:lysophospholipid acyltransferase (LPLAT)-like uncharacterized protein
MLKSLFRSRPVQSILTFLLWVYMGSVRHFIRYEVINPHTLAELRGGSGAIACFWHGRIALALAAWKPGAQYARMLISLSPDGEFVANAVQGHGIGVIRGSAGNPKKRMKAKGGISAFRSMITHIEQGGVVAITPDGPRGPRMHASSGAIRLAAQTGAPIFMFGASAPHMHLLNSWDRFGLPFPFGKGAIVWKGPIYVAADANEATMEAARAQLQHLLREASDEADRACHRVPVEPAMATSASGGAKPVEAEPAFEETQ